MRINHAVESRLRVLLTNDKLGLSDGFLTAFKGEISAVFRDYFEGADKPEVDIKENENGKIEIVVSASASKIKSFGTTLTRNV
ncbi:MAG: cell division topological specificity factor MinE [Clostridia bacterium]|nr:cell division topological specificity factor MinE [Clostridia bacterium]